MLDGDSFSIEHMGCWKVKSEEDSCGSSDFKLPFAGLFHTQIAEQQIACQGMPESWTKNRSGRNWVE
jgi:hypothetical protein